MEIRDSATIKFRSGDFYIPSPFQEPFYLETFAWHFSNRADIHMLHVSQDVREIAVVPLYEESGSMHLLGMAKVMDKEEVTDFGNILYTGSDEETYSRIWTNVLAYLRKRGMKQLTLDYVREDSRAFRYFTFVRGVEPVEQEVSPYITLPSGWGDYLESLERTDRKELKRKLNRLETVDNTFEVHDAGNEKALADFFTLHRLSDLSKHKFMNAAMEAFFRDLAHGVYLHHTPRIASLSLKGKTAASVFFFESETAAFLYNSGYDLEEKYYSPGLMVHALLIKRNIEKGLKIHDFLRGPERYKYDLGARDTKLYRIITPLS